MAKRVPYSRAADLDPEGYIIRNRRAWAWTKLERLAGSAKSEMVQLLALQEYLRRVDPVPSAATINAQLNGPVVIQWQTSSSPTPPALSSGHSTTPSNGNGHAPPASSSTDALESL